MNNPVNLVDPSGQNPLFAAMGIGGLIGGIGGAIFHALANPCQRIADMLTSGEFWRDVGVGALSGALAGLVGVFMPQLLPALGLNVQAGILAAVFGGALTGAVVSGTAQVVTNLLTGQDWKAGLGGAVLTGAVIGGIAGGLGYGVGKVLQGLKSSNSSGAVDDWLDYVPSKYQGDVADAFEGTLLVDNLSDDLIVTRYSGGGSPVTGSPWFSIKQYIKPGNARRYLALPNRNTASSVNQFIIPRGSIVIRGKVASQVGSVGYGEYAVGGGIQVYLPDPSVAILIP